MPSPRTPQREPPPDRPVLLDWHSPRHWARTEAPCRRCGQPTFLRDQRSRPCHKVCAEKEAAREHAALAANYQKGQGAW